MRSTFGSRLLKSVAGIARYGLLLDRADQRGTEDAINVTTDPG
jgi:hypothetical protein